MQSGKIIVIDGADGTGKATTTEKVIVLLRKRMIFGNAKIVSVTFPDYSNIYGKRVRAYLDGDNAHELVRVPSETRTDPYLSSMPYAEDRYYTYHKTMRPELENGSILVLDRYSSSNMAHQGAKLPLADRPDFLKRLIMLEHVYFGLPIPDRVFLLSLPEDVRCRRVDSRRTQAESSGTIGGQVGVSDIHEQNLSYMAAVAEEYRQLAHSQDWDIIECVQDDRELTPDEIAETILSHITKHFS